MNAYPFALPALTAAPARRILKNVAALSVAQIAGYLLPIFVLPYTATVLGPRYFGLFALTQAIVQYSTLVTNYGFSFSATRLAAIDQRDPQRLADIVAHVWAAKFLLMLACLAVSAAAFAAVPSLRAWLPAYLCGFVAVVGNVFYLDWFFQAIEEMKWITVVNVVPKLLLTPLIFVVVRAPEHYVRLLLIYAAISLASGAAGAALVTRRLPVRLPRPTLRGVRGQLAAGWQTFLGTIATGLYTSTNVVFLGLLADATAVGYYSAGQKVVGAIQSLWAPFSQSLYPHFCKTFHEDRGRALAQLWRLVTIVACAGLIGAVAVALAAPFVVPRYLGPRFAGSVAVMQVLIFSVAAVAVSNLLGVHGMLAAGLHAEFLRIVWAAAAVNVIFAPLGILTRGGIGLAWATLAVELFTALYAFWRLRRRTS